MTPAVGTTVSAPASATAGGPSAAGLIAFSAGAPHAEDIYVVNADGTDLRRVTSDPAADFDPTLSPDGRRLAYRHQPGDDRTTDIWVINLDGSDAAKIGGADGAADWGPAWSPDGEWVAWNKQSPTGRGFDLALVRPDGSDSRIVNGDTHVEYPAWSPDGTQIAFMSQVATEGAQYEVFVMNLDGRAVSRLTDQAGSDGWPSWSPGGTEIAFSSERDDCRFSAAADCLSTGDIGRYHTLYVMPTDGSGQRRVSRNHVQFVDWSPDGQWLVTDGDGGPGLIRPDGSTQTSLDLGLGYCAFPDWVSGSIPPD
jgi:Tol biopolymer transport system component